MSCLTGLRGSLSRLQLDYVDIVFANRNDVNSPMEGELWIWPQFGLMSVHILEKEDIEKMPCDLLLLCFACRDRARHDVCNKPGNGHVLGNVTLERHGNHGEGHFMKITGLWRKFQLSFCLSLCSSPGGVLSCTPVQPDTARV